MFRSIAGAQGQIPDVPPCSGEMLEVSVVNLVPPAAGMDAHWLAVAIHNTSPTTCTLWAHTITFPPASQYPVAGSVQQKDPSEAARVFEQKSRRLAAGETVHVLVAWSSAPLATQGLPMLECENHDSMTLAVANAVSSKKPLLEIQHLWVRICGEAWVSQYRWGPYVPGEPIQDEWLQLFQFKQSDFGRPLASDADNGAARLRALSGVEYLKGTFESGYAGYFELFLGVPSPAISNCPFDSLRKREADGETVIYVNHCEGQRTLTAPLPAAKDARLLIRELGMLPERRGRVEYEVTSEVLVNGGVELAQARTEVSVRDPMQPMLPAIDTSIPGCLTSQLKMTSPPVELGGYWGAPRAYAPPGEERQAAKVFEVTNVSNASCMIGGVPELKLLNPPEVTSGFLLPAVCRNCATPLFNPRESRWIELRPGDSGHFLVSSTLLDPDYRFACTVVGGLEMRLPGDAQQIRLPFDAGKCGWLNVSAWRAGRYDGDPLNVQFDREEKQRDEQRALAALPVPKECTDSMSADTGQPTMFPPRGDVTWGLSTKPAPYGNPVRVLLWLYNPTDKPQAVETCGNIDQFWLSGIDVFDSAGQRVFTREEEKVKKARTSLAGVVCTRNFPINIPAHSCLHGRFSQPTYDFERDLRTYFSLSPGRYYIAPLQATQQGVPVRKTPPDLSVGLPVTVLEN